MKGLVFMCKHLVFVYGTLKKNCRNNNYLSDAKYIGPAETTEKYSMREHSFHYPAVIESEQEYYIKGELWLCLDRTLKLLDRLEGIPDLFYRKEISIIQNANILNAWIYFFNYKHNKLDLRDKILEWKED
jgi:gamma-glutamylaminecyclotransferase